MLNELQSICIENLQNKCTIEGNSIHIDFIGDDFTVGPYSYDINRSNLTTDGIVTLVKNAVTIDYNDYLSGKLKQNKYEPKMPLDCRPKPLIDDEIYKITIDGKESFSLYSNGRKPKYCKFETASFNDATGFAIDYDAIDAMIKSYSAKEYENLSHVKGDGFVFYFVSDDVRVGPIYTHFYHVWLRCGSSANDMSSFSNQLKEHLAVIEHQVAGDGAEGFILNSSNI